MNEIRKLMEAVDRINEVGDPYCDNCGGDGTVDIGGKEYNCPDCNSGVGELDDNALRGAIQDMVVPQVEDDANPEEWIQLMIYAFDDLDVPFNVGVAETILADYGMEPHCDLQARFGESIEEELEVVGESGTSERQAMWAGFAGAARWLSGIDVDEELGHEFHRWLNSKDGYLK